MIVSKTTAAVVGPAVVFLLLFLTISGLVGSKVVDSPILFRDGFAWYGGVGKGLLFGLVALILLVRPTRGAAVSQLHAQAWHPGLLGWIAAAGALACVAWGSIDNLIAGQRTFANLALAHGGLFGSIILSGIGCFGIGNIRAFYKAYRRTLLFVGLLTGGFYVFLLGVYRLWEPLASIVLKCVEWLLGISGVQTVTFLPHTLMLDKFSITVAEYCSGVESIALFTSLYALIGLLDWGRMHRKRYLAIFLPALLLLFLLNIIRVYGLIMAGYYIDPQLAFGLFHTYAGMIFFILYSGVFWLIAYKYLVITETKEVSQ